MSHIKVWEMGARLGRLVISLESDTYPTAPWDFPDSYFDGFDIVFVHDEIKRKGPRKHLCNQYLQKHPGKVVMPGVTSTFKAGALLFNPKEVCLAIASSSPHRIVDYRI